MTIDIQRTVIKTQLRRLVLLVLYALLLVIIIVFGNPKYDFLGISNYLWVTIITALLAIVFVIEALLELNYIYFCDNDDRIVFRYFSMGFLNKSKNSIEIPKDRFSGYILKESLFGYKKKLILTQRIKDIDAKYPAVSISALNKEETSKLLKELDKFK